MFSSFNIELHENLVLSHVRKSFHSALKLTHQAEQLRILNFVYPKPLVMQYVNALERLGAYIFSSLLAFAAGRCNKCRNLMCWLMSRSFYSKSII